MPESSTSSASQHSSGSASQFSSSLRQISADVTPLPPQTHDVKMRDSLSHCLDICTFIRLRARAGFALPRELSRTQTQDPVSYMLWPLKDQRLSKLPEEIQRNTQSPSEAAREHDGFGLRLKVKGEQLRDIRLNPCGSSVIPLLMQVFIL